MKKLCVLFFLFLSLFTFSQTGQYIAFTSVEAHSDSVVLEYEWWELDPMIHSKIIFDYEEFCLDTFNITTGESSCLIHGLESGWYDYYWYLEDGDQHIDRTRLGSIFVPGTTLSISELVALVEEGSLRIFDLYGREIDVGLVSCNTIYILVYTSGKKEKIVFVE